MDESGYPRGGFQPPPPPPSTGKATASLVLGICSLLLWLCPIIGAVVGIIGLVLGIQAKNVQRSGAATAGVVMSLIGLVLSAGNMAYGCYLGATGQHPLIQ
jgi:hypothetical protein